MSNYGRRTKPQPSDNKARDAKPVHSSPSNRDGRVGKPSHHKRTPIDSTPKEERHRTKTDRQGERKTAPGQKGTRQPRDKAGRRGGRGSKKIRREGRAAGKEDSRAGQSPGTTTYRAWGASHRRDSNTEGHGGTSQGLGDIARLKSPDAPTKVNMQWRFTTKRNREDKVRRQRLTQKEQPNRS